MAEPTSTIQRPDLAEVVSEYVFGEAQMRYIGLKLMPIFETQRKSANFYTQPLAELLKPRSTLRAPRGGYNRGDWRFSQSSYTCVEQGWEEVVDDEEATNYRTYFDAESVSTQVAIDVILRAQEKRISDGIFTLSANNVSNKWSSASNATPLADVTAGIKSIRDNTGLMPDTMELSYTTYRNVLKTSELKEALKYTQAFEALPDARKVQMLADYFGIGRIVIGDAIQNTADEGQTASLAGIWPDAKAVICVTNSSNDLSKPCLGRTMLWTADSPDNVTVETYREEQARGQVIRVRQNTDEKLVTAAAAYVLGNLA